ncbi:122R [Invertebrate iridescent virus Kaz2018]|nr:122R [Invertebrate iridescent virus Kaz2018]
MTDKMGTDLTSFRGNLNGLYEAIKVQTALQKEAKTIKIEQKKIKDEIDTFKTAILEDLKQRDQEGVEFKGLKITIHPKPKRVYFKKADKERLICEALRNCGIEDAQSKTKNVIDAISQIHTETEDTLKIIDSKKEKKVNKY